jgi:hypothetical protein
MARIASVEDYMTTRPLKVIVITAGGQNESKVIEALRACGERTLRVSFSERRNEMRILLPDSCTVVCNTVKGVQ